MVPDSDPDGNPLSAVLAAGPTHGTLTLNAEVPSPTGRMPTSTAATRLRIGPTTAA